MAAQKKGTLSYGRRGPKICAGYFQTKAEARLASFLPEEAMYKTKKGFTTRRFVKNLSGTRVDPPVRHFHFPLPLPSREGYFWITNASPCQHG